MTPEFWYIFYTPCQRIYMLQNHSPHHGTQPDSILQYRDLCGQFMRELPRCYHTTERGSLCNSDGSTELCTPANSSATIGVVAHAVDNLP